MRTALIGFGTAGAVFHAPLIASTLTLTAIVTTDSQRRQQAQRSYPQARLLDSPADIDPEETDLVVIAAPNRHHLSLAQQALAKGLPVVIDKPVASTAAEARQLIPHAKNIAIFHNRRWDGDFLTLKKLIQSQQLGPITRFESRFERWRPQPKEGAWRESPDEGGGLLLDIGSHLVDQAVQLFGRPSHIYAEVDKKRPGVQVDDDAFIALQFPSGVRAHLWASVLTPQPGPRFHLKGLKGSYQSIGLDPQEEGLRANTPPKKALPGHLITPDYQGPHENEIGDYRDFYRLLEKSFSTGQPPPVTLDQAILVLEILEAAKAAQKKWT